MGRSKKKLMAPLGSYAGRILDASNRKKAGSKSPGKKPGMSSSTFYGSSNPGFSLSNHNCSSWDNVLAVANRKKRILLAGDEASLDKKPLTPNSMEASKRKMRDMAEQFESKEDNDEHANNLTPEKSSLLTDRTGAFVNTNNADSGDWHSKLSPGKRQRLSSKFNREQRERKSQLLNRKEPRQQVLFVEDPVTYDDKRQQSRLDHLPCVVAGSMEIVNRSRTGKATLPLRTVSHHTYQPHKRSRALPVLDINYSAADDLNETEITDQDTFHPPSPIERPKSRCENRLHPDTIGMPKSRRENHLDGVGILKIKSRLEKDPDSVEIVKVKSKFENRESPEFVRTKSRCEKFQDNIEIRPKPISESLRDGSEIERPTSSCENPERPSSQNSSFEEDFNERMNMDFGLRNLGNTCYINSVLQCILRLGPHAMDFLNINDVSTMPQESLTRNLQSLELRDSQLNPILRAIRNHTTFKIGTQQDAQEFLGQIMDKVGDELLKHCSKEMADSFVANFEVQLLKLYTCQCCEKLSKKEEKVLMLSVDVPSDSEEVFSLQTATDNYFRTEIVEANCEHCHAKSQSQDIKLSSLPKVLIVHLKRYTMKDSTVTKLLNRVKVSTVLDLNHHVQPEEVKSPVLVSPLKNMNIQQRVSPTSPVRVPFKQIENSTVATSKNVSPKKKPISLKGGISSTVFTVDDESPYPSSSEVTKNGKLETTSRSQTDMPSKSQLSTPTKSHMETPSKCQSESPINSQSETETPQKTSYLSDSAYDKSPEVRHETIANSPEVRSERPSETIVEPTSIISPDDFGGELLDEDPDERYQRDLKETLEISKFYEDKQVELTTENERAGIPPTFEEQLKMATEISLQENNQFEKELEAATQASLLETAQWQDTVTNHEEEEEVDCIEEEQVKSFGPNQYQLIGIVDHHGHSVVGGHYTASVFDAKTDAWYNYDDNVVHTVSLASVKRNSKTTGYLFFYVEKT